MERVAETAELLGVEASIGKPKLVQGCLGSLAGIEAGQAKLGTRAAEAAWQFSKLHTTPHQAPPTSTARLLCACLCRRLGMQPRTS